MAMLHYAGPHPRPAADPFSGRWVLDPAASRGVVLPEITYAREGTSIRVSGELGDDLATLHQLAPRAFDLLFHRLTGPRRSATVVIAPDLMNGHWRRHMPTAKGAMLTTEALYQRVGQADGDFPLAGRWRHYPIMRIDAKSGSVYYNNGMAFEAGFDGRHYPALSSDGIDSVIVRRPSPNAIERNDFKGLRQVRAVDMIVSDDGGRVVIRTHRDQDLPPSVAVYNRMQGDPLSDYLSGRPRSFLTPAASANPGGA